MLTIGPSSPTYPRGTSSGAAIRREAFGHMARLTATLERLAIGCLLILVRAFDAMDWPRATTAVRILFRYCRREGFLVVFMEDLIVASDEYPIEKCKPPKGEMTVEPPQKNCAARWS